MFAKNVSARTSILFASLIVINTVNAQEEKPAAGLFTNQSVEMTVIGSGDIGGGATTFQMGFSGGGSEINMFGDTGFTMPAPDPLSMLSNPSVQKDLELIGKLGLSAKQPNPNMEPPARTCDKETTPCCG